jgi:outer membrane lipoprotein-sorting protein
MRKIFLITSLFLVCCGSAVSQNGRVLSATEKAAFEQKMVEQSKKIQTLQCHFVQEKTSTLVVDKSVAKGILLYQSPSALRWEYTEPTASTLILNGKNAELLDKSGKKQGNAAVLKQLGGIIISMINGEGLRQNKQFSTKVFEDEKDFIVILTPVQKRIKEFYKSIELKINKNSYLASYITMNEKSDDKTVIALNGIKLNETIDNDKFAVK